VYLVRVVVLVSVGVGRNEGRMVQKIVVLELELLYRPERKVVRGRSPRRGSAEGNKTTICTWHKARRLRAGTERSVAAAQIAK
jgi:hypothetical protein